ncbi:MAG: glutamate--tRNA ligase family protein, partial [Aureliella sp.]
ASMDRIASAQDSNVPPKHIDYIQTRRLGRYQQVLEQLFANGSIYACTCSRTEVARSASAPHESSLAALEGPIYAGTCRPSKKTGARRSISSDQFAWRWCFAEGEVNWTDQLHGIMSANPAQQFGDFVIARAMWPNALPPELNLEEQHADPAIAHWVNTPAYQLAVVVDDHDMHVTEVVRGDDLIFSTFRQLAILEQLGWPVPRYIHVPLMIGRDGRRLAKRHGDSRLSSFRQRGVAPECVVGYLAWTLGLQAAPQPLLATDLIGRLDWQAIPLSPTIVDNDLLPF